MERGQRNGGGRTARGRSPGVPVLAAALLLSVGAHAAAVATAVVLGRLRQPGGVQPAHAQGPGQVEEAPVFITAALVEGEGGARTPGPGLGGAPGTPPGGRGDRGRMLVLRANGAQEGAEGILPGPAAPRAVTGSALGPEARAGGPRELEGSRAEGPPGASEPNENGREEVRRAGELQGRWDERGDGATGGASGAGGHAATGRRGAGGEGTGGAAARGAGGRAGNGDGAGGIGGAGGANGTPGAGGGAGGAGAVDPRHTIAARVAATKHYPVLARRRGLEGTVVVEFSVGQDGLARDLAIVRSAGQILDDAARAAVLRARGLPLVSGRVRVPLRFRLTESP